MFSISVEAFNSASSSTLMINSSAAGSSKSSKMKEAATKVADWLRQNFEYCGHAHISRERLYQEYSDSCTANGIHGLNAASFGKILRSVFPSVSTRRLGTRGNSKYLLYFKASGNIYNSRYHYQGLKPKFEQIPCVLSPPKLYRRQKSSESTTSVVNTHAVENSSETFEQPKKFTLSSGPIPGLHIPDEEFIEHMMLKFAFPEPPVDVDAECFNEFFCVYRDHTKEFLKSALIGDYDKVTLIMKIHWDYSFAKYQQLFLSGYCCRLVAEWDMMLYQFILSLVLPDILAEGDKELLQRFSSFIQDGNTFLALTFTWKTSNILKQEKARALAEFSRMLKEYQTLNHLALATRELIESEISDRMVGVWRNLDMESVTMQAFSICPQAPDILRHVHENIMHKFLAKSSIFRWAEWIFSLFEECMAQDNTAQVEEFTALSQQFIVKWSYISSLIMREVQDQDRNIQAAFNTFKLFVEEYLKFSIDCKIEEKRRNLEYQVQNPQHSRHDMERDHYESTSNLEVFYKET